MINAKEARELAITSDNHINGCCDQIGIKISEFAKHGHRELILDTEFPYDPEYKINKPVYLPAEFTNQQKRIKDILEKNGYNVKIIEVEHSGRGGLGCMDDDPQPFSTWHIRISW